MTTTAGLTDAELDVVCSYIRMIADTLGLTEWEFRVEDLVPPDDDENPPWAHIDFVYGRRFATIGLCEDFRDLTDRRQRHVIVHELLHCHLELLMQEFKIALRGLGGGQEAPVDMAIALLCQQVEYLTDLMATRIAMLLPMIDWTTDAKETREADLHEPGTHALRGGEAAPEQDALPDVERC